MFADSLDPDQTQTVGHNDSVPQNFFLLKLILKTFIIQQQKHGNYPACKELNSQLKFATDNFFKFCHFLMKTYNVMVKLPNSTLQNSQNLNIG